MKTFLNVVGYLLALGVVACAIAGIWTGVAQWGLTALILGLAAIVTFADGSQK